MSYFFQFLLNSVSVKGLPEFKKIIVYGIQREMMKARLKLIKAVSKLVSYDKIKREECKIKTSNQNNKLITMNKQQTRKYI